MFGMFNPFGAAGRMAGGMMRRPMQPKQPGGFSLGGGGLFPQKPDMPRTLPQGPPMMNNGGEAQLAGPSPELLQKLFAGGGMQPQVMPQRNMLMQRGIF